MKKQVKVIGIQHKTGTNKAGKPYDFYMMHCIHNEVNTDGHCTCSVIVPDDVVATAEIGAEYTLFTHFYNGKECFDWLIK